MSESKRRFGDRKDGRKIRSLAPYNTISCYIMVSRNDSQNFFADNFETTEADRYILQKRKSGLDGFGMMHVLVAAYVRTVSQRPYINRFISGQKIFARNRIEVNMVVKKRLSADEMDTVIKVIFEPDDTAEKVYLRFKAAIAQAFGESENNFDGTARILNYIPGPVKKFAFWFFKFLDYFGLLPTALLKISPFHGSMFITSMGSLGIPPIYHHLYNFGNVPLFLSFGSKRTENALDEQGNVVKKKYIDYTFVTDERICDGFAFASGLKLFRSYLANPTVLDEPPKKVAVDIE